MSSLGNVQSGDGPRRANGGAAGRRIRNRALMLMSLALVFYFGFIAVTFYRSHH